MAKTARIRLGAATDNPLALLQHARRGIEEARRRGDSTALREAAEMGWLAASSTADVVAAKLGQKVPKGASGRRAVLVDLEDRARLRRGTLIGPFEAARTVLHGECFHGDECDPRSIDGIINGVQDLATTALRAAPKRSRRG